MKKLLASLLLFTLLLTTSFAGTDDFNDGDDLGWTQYNPLAAFGAGATYSFPAGGYRIAGPASPNPTLLGPSRAGSIRNDETNFSFRISFDLVDWNNTADQAFGALARVREVGLGTLDGYAFTYSTDGSIDLSRINNEAPTGLGSAAVTLNPANDYRFVFVGVGTTLVGEVFDLANLSTPLATVFGNDAAFTNGLSGLVVFDNSPTELGTTDATFDNFVVIVPEPSTYALFGLGAAVLAWRRWKKK